MSSKAKTEILSLLKEIGPELVEEILSESKQFILPSSSGEPPDRVVKAVVNCALKRLEGTLAEDSKPQAAQSLGVPVANLRATLEDTDVDVFVNSAPTDLLKKYARQLSLDPTAERDEMRKSIADEVMLTGTEAFLTSLSPKLLCRLCSALRLASDNHELLVEGLMVYAFHLCPSNEEAPSQPSPEKSQPKKSTSPRKPKPAPAAASSSPSSTSQEEEEKKAKTTMKKRRGRPSKSKKEDPESEDEESDDEDDEGEDEAPMKQKKKTRKDDEGKGDSDAPKGHYEGGKWVAPPFEAVLEGKYTKQTMHNNFNLADLEAFCRKFGLPTGKKSTCISTILRFVDERKAKGGK